MTRARRSLPQAEQARLHTVRAEARRTLTDALLRAPGASEDILGAIAWYAAILGVDHAATHSLIAKARDDRWQWREIALACGLDEDKATAEALGLSHRRRTQQR